MMVTPENSENTNNSGSPTAGEPVIYLAVGTLNRAHGVRGDILLVLMTDFPERLKPGTMVYLGDRKQQIKITRRRPHNEGLLLGLEGVHTPEQAAQFRSQVVYVKTQNLPALPEGEYYHHQIIGLIVEDESGRELGKITEIIETGANDVYVVSRSDKPSEDILIPALKQVLLDINLEAKKMRVHILPGLIDHQEDTD